MTLTHRSATHVYDNLNRLLEDDTFTYIYDNNGNLTGKTDKVTLATTTYVYDANNKLIQIITPTNTIQYQYDPYGRRIARILNGATTRYIYDNEDILLELDQNGNIEARYTHGPGIDEPLSVTRDTNGDGTLDTTYYYHTDGLGSITTLTNSAGSVVQSYTYDAFGNITSQTGVVENSYTYTGREWDSEANLYYYRARYYDANIGRFITEDPIGFGGGVDFYPYVANNATNRTDPSGLEYGLWDPLGPNYDPTQNNYPCIECDWKKLGQCILLAYDPDQSEACRTMCTACPTPLCKALCVACLAYQTHQTLSCFKENCRIKECCQ